MLFTWHVSTCLSGQVRVFSVTFSLCPSLFQDWFWFHGCVGCVSSLSLYLASSMSLLTTIYQGSCHRCISRRVWSSLRMSAKPVEWPRTCPPQNSVSVVSLYCLQPICQFPISFIAVCLTSWSVEMDFNRVRWVSILFSKNEDVVSMPIDLLLWILYTWSVILLDSFRFAGILYLHKQ